MLKYFLFVLLNLFMLNIIFGNSKEFSDQFVPNLANSKEFSD